LIQLTTVAGKELDGYLIYGNGEGKDTGRRNGTSVRAVCIRKPDILGIN